MKPKSNWRSSVKWNPSQDPTAQTPNAAATAAAAAVAVAAASSAAARSASSSAAAPPPIPSRVAPSPPAAATATPAPPPAPAPAPAPSVAKPKVKLDKYYALAGYAAEDEGELTIHEDDIIEVVDRDDENGDGGWWYCRNLTTGSAGLAPSNFLAPLD